MSTVRLVIASTRPHRLGPVIADFVRAQAPRDLAVEVTDLAELGLPFLDEPQLAASGVYTHEHTRRWAQLIGSSDAVLVVTPEYNNGYPAALKNAIDYLYAEWSGKPVGLVGYGYRGASSCLAQLTTVFERLKANLVGTVSLAYRDHLDGEPGPGASVRPDDALRRELVKLYARLRSAAS